MVNHVVSVRHFSMDVASAEAAAEAVPKAKPVKQYSVKLREFQKTLDQNFKADRKVLYQSFNALARHGIKVPADSVLKYVTLLCNRREPASARSVVAVFIKQQLGDGKTVDVESQENCQDVISKTLIQLVKKGFDAEALILWADLDKQRAFVTTTHILQRLLKDLAEAHSIKINWEFVEKIHALLLANHGNRTAEHYVYMFRLVKQAIAAGFHSPNSNQKLKTLVDRSRSLFDEYKSIFPYQQSGSDNIIEDQIHGRLNVETSFLRAQKLAFQYQLFVQAEGSREFVPVVTLADLQSTFDAVLETLRIRKQYPVVQSAKLASASQRSGFPDAASAFENISSFLKLLFRFGYSDKGLLMLDKYLALVCTDKKANGNLTDHGDSAYHIFSSVIRYVDVARGIKIPSSSGNHRPTILKYQDLDQLEENAKKLISLAQKYEISLTPPFYGGWVTSMLRPDTSYLKRDFPMSSSFAHVYRYASKFGTPSQFFFVHPSTDGTTNAEVPATSEQFPRFDWRDTMERAYRVVDFMPTPTPEYKEKVLSQLHEQIIQLLCRFESKEPLQRALAILKEHKILSLKCHTHIIYASVWVNDIDTYNEVTAIADAVANSPDETQYWKLKYTYMKMFALTRWNRAFEAWQLLDSPVHNGYRNFAFLGRLYSWMIKSFYFSNPTSRSEWLTILNPGKLTKSLVQRMSRDGIPLHINHVIGLIQLFSKAGGLLHSTKTMDNENSSSETVSSADVSDTNAILEKQFFDPTAIESVSVQDILNDMNLFVKSVCVNPKSTVESKDRFIVEPLHYTPEIVTKIVKVYCHCGLVDQATTIAKNAETYFGVKPDSKLYAPIFYSLCKDDKISEAELLLTEMLNAKYFIHFQIINPLVQYYLQKNEASNALDCVEEIYNQTQMSKKFIPDFFIDILEVSLQNSDEFEANRVVTFIRQRFSVEDRLKAKYVKRIPNYKFSSDDEHANHPDNEPRVRGKISSSPFDSHRLTMERECLESEADSDSRLETSQELTSFAEDYEKVYEAVEYNVFSEEGLQRLFAKHGLKLLPPGAQHSFD